MELDATYYTGQTARAHTVRLHVNPGGAVRVSGWGVEGTWPLDAVTIAPRVGNIPRTLRLPDGATIEVADNDAIDACLDRHDIHATNRLVASLEARWAPALAAVLVTGILTWLFVTVGVPAFARATANLLPPEMDAHIGSETLAIMDELIFEPSELTEGRRAELLNYFDQLAAYVALGRPVELAFRSGGEIGANAFALPSGTVVMTDELVGLADNDEQIIAVMAHEIGHVAERHSIRLVLQDSVTVLLFAVVLGDIGSVTGLAGALPTVLLQTGYSRVFELEADNYAVALMNAFAIDPGEFAEMLRRLTGAGDADGSGPNFLSTHPAPADRIARLEALSGAVP